MSPRRNPSHVTALAYLVSTIRPDWDRPGVEAVINSIETAIPWPAICHAAITAAATRDDQHTPTVIRMSGAHWAGCTGEKPVTTLPSWRDPHADVVPADPATIRAIRKGARP